MRAGRIVAQRLQAVAGLGPRRTQFGARGIEHRLAVTVVDDDAIEGFGGAEVAHHRAQARGSEHRPHFGETRGLDLQHGPEFFREEFGDRRSLIPRRQRDVEPAMAGESHLGQRREQSAVRSIVVREDQFLASQFDDRADECTQPAGVIAVRRGSRRSGRTPAPGRTHRGDRDRRPDRRATAA